jgi:hypothetical protein
MQDEHFPEPKDPKCIHHIIKHDGSESGPPRLIHLQLTC